MVGVLPVSQMIIEPVSIKKNQGLNQEEGSSFGKILSQAISDVNQSQVKADRMENQLITGEIQNLDQVIIAMEEARLMMSLAIEVRNRVIEAYQEVSRMQV